MLVVYDGRTEQKGPRGGTSEEKTHQKNIEDKIDGGSAFFFFILNFTIKKELFFLLFSETKQNMYEEGHMNLCVCVLDARYTYTCRSYIL